MGPRRGQKRACVCLPVGKAAATSNTLQGRTYHECLSTLLEARDRACMLAHERMTTGALHLQGIGCTDNSQYIGVSYSGYYA